MLVFLVVNANAPIDWNCNGVDNDAAVSTSINGDGGLDLLRGFDEWPNLLFGGGEIGGLGQMVEFPMDTEIDELDAEAADHDAHREGRGERQAR